MPHFKRRAHLNVPPASGYKETDAGQCTLFRRQTVAYYLLDVLFFVNQKALIKFKFLFYGISKMNGGPFPCTLCLEPGKAKAILKHVTVGS